MILRNRRKGRGVRKSAQPRGPSQSAARRHPDRPVQSVEALLGGNQGRIGGPDEEASLVEQPTDPEEAFNRKWGYLPPLDEEAAAIIDAIIMNPANAIDSARRNPTSSDFHQGLRRRNVSLGESMTPDVYAASINSLPQISLQETDAERESYERLWTLDRAKCMNGSNEALFQRTLMMSFIARHCLIYGQGATGPLYLDFSVEELWTCPPMPTEDYCLSNKGLTQPKPDLAVCFSRKMLIPDGLWLKMPDATQRLASYEKPDELGQSRAFYFFTIEGKRSQTTLDDNTARYQSLNNASQALHNMFEFFHDAGPRHREKFFSEVRFFSAVASTEGLNVRIHRATQFAENDSEDDFVIPGYPLRFEFREFARIPKDGFDRETVLELFGKILDGYAVKRLHGLLKDAAKDLMEKLNKNPEERQLRQDLNFYRHGQLGKSTPVASTRHSTYSPMSVDRGRSGTMPGPPNMAVLRPDQSFDMLPSRTATPTQSQPPPLTQVSSSSRKRGSHQLEDGKPRRRTRMRGSN